jgi:carbonic anhydrase/acetyltransferase-like protein (isoleucine patch superfamily)
MKEDQKTWIPVSLLVPTFFVVLATVPVAGSVLPIFVADALWIKVLAAASAPLIWAALYLAVSILFAAPFSGAITRGKFPRDIRHCIYGPRRIYGLAWGAFFYCTPLYFAVMSITPIRNRVLRAFGYQGSDNASIAPDAWLRDLPLLDFGPASYVANKSTIGSNMCLSNNSILVDRITLGERAMVGHLAMVAPGSVLGGHSELGVGAALGIRTQIGSRCRIGPSAGVNHGAILEDDVEIGTMTYVGIKARVARGVRVPSGVCIPEGADIRTQDDLERVLGLERQRLVAEAERWRRSYPAPDEVGQGKVVGITRKVMGA